MSRPGAPLPAGHARARAQPEQAGAGRGSAVWPREGEAGAAAAAPEGRGEPAEPPADGRWRFDTIAFPGHVGALLSSPFLQGRDIPLKPGRREPPRPGWRFQFGPFPAAVSLPLPRWDAPHGARLAAPGPLRPGPHGGRSNGPWGLARPVLWPAIGPFPGLVPNLVSTQSCVSALRRAPRPPIPPSLCPLPPSRPPTSQRASPPRPQSSLVLKSSKELARLLDHSPV